MVRIQFDLLGDGDSKGMEEILFATMKLRGCTMPEWHHFYFMKGLHFRMELWNLYLFNF